MIDDTRDNREQVKELMRQWMEVCFREMDNFSMQGEQGFETEALDELNDKASFTCWSSFNTLGVSVLRELGCPKEIIAREMANSLGVEL